MDFAKTIELTLSNGIVAELQMTSKLLDQVVEAFELSGPEQVTQQHVKRYLISGMKKALGDTNERHTS